MFQTLALLIPVYLLILLGYVATRVRLVAPEGLPYISRFTLVICVPVLIASAVSRLGGLADFNWQFLFGYAVASLAVIFAGAKVLRHFAGLTPGVSWSLALGMGNSNSIFLGYPIALIVFPELADNLLPSALVVENLITIPFALIVADVVAQTGGQSLRQSVAGTLRRMMTNPVLIGLAAGLLLAAAGVTFPEPLERTRLLIVSAAPVLALFVVGGNVAMSRVSEVGRPVVIVAVFKLLVHPACVFLALLALPGVPLRMAEGGLLFAALPMLAIYPIFAARHGAERFAASALAVSTMAGAVTLAILITLLLG